MISYKQQGSLEMYQLLSYEDHSHMFQADLSPSWGFPHAPKQAGSSSHELSTTPSEPFANVKTTILQIPKNKTSLIDIEEREEDTCKEGGGQVRQ